VALSTTDDWNGVLVDAIMELLEEMSELICTKPIVYCKVFEDNSGALELARLPKLRPCPRVHTRSTLMCATTITTTSASTYKPPTPTLKLKPFAKPLWGSVRLWVQCCAITCKSLLPSIVFYFWLSDVYQSYFLSFVVGRIPSVE
jgi:hypothetical protein